MKQTALVTGASSGIGEAISRTLLEEGYEVYGVGRDFSSCSLTHQEGFHALMVDLLNTNALLNVLASIPTEHFTLLVNNAGAAWYGPHETIPTDAIRIMTRTNLEAPMILANYFLRVLRKNKGTIINIASVTALHTSTHAAAYGALKAGLLHFGRTLFEENRKSGLRVTTILPDMTDTRLYRNADFTADTSDGASLFPEDVAAAVMQVLHQREGTILRELVLQPQLNRIRRKSK